MISSGCKWDNLDEWSHSMSHFKSRLADGEIDLHQDFHFLSLSLVLSGTLLAAQASTHTNTLTVLVKRTLILSLLSPEQHSTFWWRHTDMFVGFKIMLTYYSKHFDRKSWRNFQTSVKKKIAVGWNEIWLFRNHYFALYSELQKVFHQLRHRNLLRNWRETEPLARERWPIKDPGDL